MLLQLEKGRKLGCPWLYFPALADSLMSNMGLCSPNTAPPIHKRHQPRLLWHSHPRKAVFQGLQERDSVFSFHPSLKFGSNVPQVQDDGGTPCTRQQISP